jgi:hypothetical protein
MSLTKSCCSTVLLLIVAALPLHSAVLSYTTSHLWGLSELAIVSPDSWDYGSFSFPGFNPALGTLNLVLIEQEITSEVHIDLLDRFTARFVGTADVVFETFGPSGGGLLIRLSPAAFFFAVSDPSNGGIFKSFGYASGSATTCCAPFVSASDRIELPFVGYPVINRIAGNTIPLWGFVTEYRVDMTLSYFYVPEPSTWSMLLLALILFGLRKWCAPSRSRT